MQELWFLHSACSLMLIDICMKFREDCRASINFQTQEVPDFLHLRFGSPTGKSRKSHFFRAAAGWPLFRKT